MATRLPGRFLIGRVQEILATCNNLFGDTHAVHVSLDSQGGVVLDAVIKGDTVREVCSTWTSDTNALVNKLRADVRARGAREQDDVRAVRPPAEVLRRRAGWYTYLE